MNEQVIYVYGPMAWFWRALIGAALTGGLICLVSGIRLNSLVLLFMAAVLLVPAVFFGVVFAVRIYHQGEDRLQVVTLLFLSRRVTRSRLGTPRIRTDYEGRAGPMYAPRLWIPVQQSVPIYIDLLGKIPDRQAFRSALGLKAFNIP